MTPAAAIDRRGDAGVVATEEKEDGGPRQKLRGQGRRHLVYQQEPIGSDTSADQGHRIAMANALGLFRIVTPAQREHVAGALEHNGLPPTFLKRLMGDYQMARRDLVPIPRQIGRRAAGA